MQPDPHHPPTLTTPPEGVTEQTIKPRTSTIQERLGAGVLATGSLAVLGLAAWLTPATEGHGTHEQIGLTPCPWAATLDSPCFTCGMTTSFAHAAHASPLQSFLTQPMGALLALGTSVIFWASLHVLLTGSRLGPVGAQLLRPKPLWIVAGLTLAAWIYKIITW